MKYYIGVDLGGTNLAAGVVREDGAILEVMSVPTDRSWGKDALCDQIADLCKELMKRGNVSVTAIGVGVPGTANLETGCMEYANNLAANGVRLVEELKKRLNLPVAMENDANAAAWAEYCLGVGAGANDFLMVTLGTGVGGGMILGGRMVRGVNFAAGEFGHMVLHSGGRACTCGRRGCFEQYASATGLILDAKEQIEREPDGALAKAEKAGELNGKTIFSLAASGDPGAMAVRARFIADLAEGLIDLINIFQPQVLALGGGIGNGASGFLDELRERIAKFSYSRDAKRQTQVLAAKLGNDAGILGAALVAKELEIDGR